MEHPFLTPMREKTFDSRLGVEGRAAKRHAQVKRAVRFVDELIFNSLPGLVADPPAPISNDDFAGRVAEMSGELAKLDVPRQARSVAWMRFCRFIDRGNDESRWNLKPVMPLTQVPSQPLMRSRRWQRNATALHENYGKTVAAIEDSDEALLNDKGLLIGLVIFFAGVHSGICSPVIIKSLVKAIIDKQKLDLDTESGRVSIELVIQKANRTNERTNVDGTVTPVLVARPILDPLTICLIRRCWDADGSYPDTELDRNKLIKWMNRALTRLDKSVTRFTSLKQFGDVAPSYIERYTNLPNVYFEVA